MGVLTGLEPLDVETRVGEPVFTFGEVQSQMILVYWALQLGAPTEFGPWAA